MCAVEDLGHALHTVECIVFGLVAWANADLMDGCHVLSHCCAFSLKNAVIEQPFNSRHFLKWAFWGQS